MIVDDLVSDICEKLNLTSDEAKSRVIRELNTRYRRVTSSIGLETSRRTQTQITVNIASQEFTFQGIDKIIAVIDKRSGKSVPLTQVTVDEMYNLPIASGDNPHNFAVKRTHKSTIDVLIDCLPTTQFILYADGYNTIGVTLVGSVAPDFPEDFHDILIYGVMADEYRRMEKLDLAKDAELNYESRLSDLRMFISKSAYLDIYQGKDTPIPRWMRNVWNQ